ncbi:hypothetical protein SZ54_0988 [Rhizobium sp. UR51a]|nr:hypothetical protein SZ54_0988 [Rhizobium sp. UR51a]
MKKKLRPAAIPAQNAFAFRGSTGNSSLESEKSISISAVFFNIRNF